MLIYHQSGIDPFNLPHAGGIRLPNYLLSIVKSGEFPRFHMSNLMLKTGAMEVCAGGWQDPIKRYPQNQGQTCIGLFVIIYFPSEELHLHAIHKKM